MLSTSLGDVTRVELCGAAVGHNSSALGHEERPLNKLALRQDDDAANDVELGDEERVVHRQLDGAAEPVEVGRRSFLCRALAGGRGSAAPCLLPNSVLNA